MQTRQDPIGSGFNASSTAAEVIQGTNLSGKLAIVTGGYSGLGLETVRALASAGADIIVPARDVARGREALDGIDNVEVRRMDLADRASVALFAEGCLKDGRALDILINSAGVMGMPTLEHDERGHERHLGVNHLGHFELTLPLWPLLAKSGKARVVSVASLTHQFSAMHFDDLDYERRPYDCWSAYGQSKTANVLFAVELDRRGAGLGIRAFAVHPGTIVATNLARHMSFEDLQAAGVFDERGEPMIDPAKGMKTIEQGAATSIWCATAPTLEGKGGVYCEDCDIASLTQENAAASLKSTAGSAGVMPYAVDPAFAETLWRWSERTTGLTLPE